MTLRERLASGEPIVADGGMGTSLAARGHGDGCPEAVNLTHPTVLEEIAREFLDAGAELLQTNTFGGSPIRLAKSGLLDRTEGVNCIGAATARSVCGDSAWIAGSCGPCGRHLLPFGDLEPEELRASAARQLIALADSGVDAFSIETQMDVEEALIVLATAQDVAPDVVTIVSLTFAETPDGFFTHFGTPLSEAISRCEAAGADVVGSNCGTGMATMIRIESQVRRVTALPVIIQPNAGLPDMASGRPIWPETPEEFGAGARTLLSQGATILGGCCGTTPAHIAALRAAVQNHQNPDPKPSVN
jgi:5-methyltetrahydrofolate--homocysteine methyltransferase